MCPFLSVSFLFLDFSILSGFAAKIASSLIHFLKENVYSNNCWPMSAVLLWIKPNTLQVNEFKK